MITDARAELATYRPSTGEQQLLRSQFEERLDGEHATSRQGAPSHLTASAVVLSPALDAVLLVLHRKVGRWMQPGGHVDEQDCCLAGAALREAVEETGVAELRLASLVPVHLERHAAPCGVEHHLDVRFLVLAPAAAATSVSEESLDVAWWPVEALPSGSVPGLDELVQAGIAAARHPDPQPVVAG